MACSSSCKTKDHKSYGECLRSKNLKMAYARTALTGVDADTQKRADKTLESYANARKYGIQPASTNKRDVDFAIRKSDETGTAYQAT